jgi:hypothetical protein
VAEQAAALEGGSSMFANGFLYFPTAALFFSGGASGNGTKTTIVSYALAPKGNSYVTSAASGGYDAAVGAHTSAASAARIALPLAELGVGRRSGLASGLCTTITAFRIAGWVASPTPGRGISSAGDGRESTWRSFHCLEFGEEL